jgi:hypothetical protein
MSRVKRETQAWRRPFGPGCGARVARGAQQVLRCPFQVSKANMQSGNGCRSPHMTTGLLSSFLSSRGLEFSVWDYCLHWWWALQLAVGTVLFIAAERDVCTRSTGNVRQVQDFLLPQRQLHRARARAVKSAVWGVVEVDVLRAVSGLLHGGWAGSRVSF